MLTPEKQSAGKYLTSSKWLARHRRLSASAPLAEFVKEYAFLGVLPSPRLSQDANKQNYMFNYSIYFLVRSVFFAILTLLVLLVTSFCFYKQIVFLASNVFFENLWPWHGYLIKQLKYASKINGYWTHSPDELRIFTIIVSEVGLVWVFWLIYLSINTLISSYYSYFSVTAAFVCLALAAIGWFSNWIPLSKYGGLKYPGINEPIILLSGQLAVYISVTYVFAGAAFTFTLLTIRSMWRRKRRKNSIIQTGA